MPFIGALVRIFAWVASGYIANDVVDIYKQPLAQRPAFSIQSLFDSVKSQVVNIAVLAITAFVAIKFILPKFTTRKRRRR